MKQMGAYFKEKLVALKKDCPVMTEVRGNGLMLGLDLDASVSALEIKKKLLGAGFVAATAGTNVLRFLPPYVIQKDHIDSLTDTLKKLLT
jgi:acetylornithine/succinyldiaminopimelate/putrescine aminotransferase